MMPSRNISLKIRIIYGVRPIVRDVHRVPSKYVSIVESIS